MFKNFLLISMFLFASLAFARQTSGTSSSGRASACSNAKSSCSEDCGSYADVYECKVTSSCDCEKSKSGEWTCYVDCKVTGTKHGY